MQNVNMILQLEVRFIAYTTLGAFHLRSSLMLCETSHWTYKPVPVPDNSVPVRSTNYVSSTKIDFSGARSECLVKFPNKLMHMTMIESLLACQWPDRQAPWSDTVEC